MDCRPLRTALFFEELEPRLLYSADLAGVVDTGAPEQDVEEESAITADLESTEESDAAQQEEDEESAQSTLSAEPMEPAEELGSSAGDVGAVEETEEVAEATGSESLPDTAAEETSPTDTPPASSAGEDSDSAAITADDSNAAPVVTMPDTAVSYAPGDPPAILAPDATVGDDDSDDFKQGTLTVSISQGGTDDDQLLIVEGGDVSLLNNNIKVEQKLVGSFAGGSDGMALIISWSPQATPAYAEAVLRQIAYNHDSADPSPVSRTIDFVLTDGDGGTSDTVQAIINGAGEPGLGEGDGAGETGSGEEEPGESIAPVLTQTDGPFDYAGGASAILIAPSATVVDIDSEDFKQGTLTVSFSAGGNADDQLLIVEGGDVSLLNNNIKVDQKLVGSFAGGTDGTALVISWSPQATPAYAEAVLHQIAYCNGSAEPVPGSRTVDFVLTDGDGGTSNTVQAVIDIAGIEVPGGDLGQGEGEESEEGGEGDTGDGEIIPPVDEPINDPVDGQDDTLEPIDLGSGGQSNPEGGQEKAGGAGDDSGILTPPVPPSSDPVVLENAEFAAVGSGSTEFLAANGNWRDESQSPQKFQEKDDVVGRVEKEYPAGQERVASDGAWPRPDGSVEYGKGDGGYDFSLSGQPVASAVQGQEAGDAPHEATLAETLKTTMSRLLGFFTSSAVSPSLDLPPAPDQAVGSAVTNNEMVCREVEVMRQEMEEAFLQSNRAGKLMAYTTTGVSLSLAAGIARYFFHSGSLLSGFLATIPLWKSFDPVAVLRTPKNDRKKTGAISPSVGAEPIEQKAETMFAAGGGASCS